MQTAKKTPERRLGTTLNVVNQTNAGQAGCGACRMDGDDPFPFTMAFQPIVQASGVFAYEALVRGPAGESAGSVLAQVDASNMYAFDQACRVKAIEMASALHLDAQQKVSINFIPGAVYRPENCIRKTLETAQRVGMPLKNIIFEVTEGERVSDRAHLLNIFHEYRKHGLRTAIDDFGAGYAGLDLLSEFQPDILKLDMGLIRDIDTRAPSRAIVRAVVSLCQELGIQVIAEGIETEAELAVLQDLGIELFQGYLFARPQVGLLAKPYWPGGSRAGSVEQLSDPRKHEAGLISTL